ncbi:right-handed parallel beta-helix repeat-containing protein [Myxococcus llanfairpwllgwyngyllgogerychwyrndrobwllllantysiliogogogochensis]|uniref:Right-handed parallel beta-helix repeat-containing protein n=1 Tax=Myxococcus llanfairpwllgwyngyllgogerychwyrndrobwllllantysiliogogogochensis TaxID=2590453 RepID=A0A540WQM8_9BACT|nr:right-handed parallel beta-helix repeat-containing protein [Myxococcus llanfairpwllgwyngyllgogerychwyrndrobwllllantysiliogogogochensis]
MKTSSFSFLIASVVAVSLSVSAFACSGEDSSTDPEDGVGVEDGGGLVRDAGGEPERDAGGEPERDAGREPERDAGGEPERDAGGEPERDAGGEPERDAGGEPERDAGGEPERDAGGEPERDAGPGTSDGGDSGVDGGSGPDPVDAGRADAGTDGGASDGGLDAGQDAGPVEVPTDGGTVVTGTLSGTLTVAGSPYRVIGNAQGVVTIPKGQVLKVQPGVILDFKGRPEVTEADVAAGAPDSVMNHQKGRVEVRVYGGIQVSGTADKPVLLTSTNPYGWWGMNFYGDNSVGDGHPVFDHMVFEKVRKNEYNGDRDWTRGALWAYYPGPVTIRNSVFRDNVSAAKCGALDLMFTVGSRVEGTLFEGNRTSDIDRFAQAGTSSMAGGGAMCVTHGRDSVVRGNTFRNNGLEAFRGSVWSGLTVRPVLAWPNSQNIYDLGGGAALHYFQPNNDLIVDNLFEDNFVTKGPAAAIYVEDVGTRGVTLRHNRFLDNQAGAGGVVVCNRGSGAVELVVESDNVFSGNTVNGNPAPNVTGDCTVAAQ